MKKLLFAAILATVAVGGAYAVDYSTGPNGTGTKFRCINTIAPLCETAAPKSVYVYPNGTTLISLPTSEYPKTYTTF